MNVLSVDGLTKRYKSFTLDGVSFSVKQGEIMGFIGRNGAGKTTTLKSMMGLVNADGGDVRFFGEKLNENESVIKNRIGFVSGGVDYYMRKKIKTITDVTRRFYSNWDDEAYRLYMSRFSLDEGKTPLELSCGMKVKYNLALALSHKADLLILDEPTSGLDPISRDDLLDVFLDLSREGVSILFSTHITSDLDKCADAITYIIKGKIVASKGIKDFEDSYRFVKLPDGDIEPDLARRLIGLKRAKEGYTAIVTKENSDKIGLNCEKANLETIMVHMEKEGQ